MLFLLLLWSVDYVFRRLRKSDKAGASVDAAKSSTHPGRRVPKLALGIIAAVCSLLWILRFQLVIASTGVAPSAYRLDRWTGDVQPYGIARQFESGRRPQPPENTP